MSGFKKILIVTNPIAGHKKSLNETIDLVVALFQ
jgi:hypothetical protein